MPPAFANAADFGGIDVVALRRIAGLDEAVRQRRAEQAETRDADLPRRGHCAAISFRIASSACGLVMCGLWLASIS